VPVSPEASCPTTVPELEHTMLLQELHTQQHSMKTHQKICIKSQRHSGFCTSQAEARKNERSQLRQITMQYKHMIQQSQYIWLQMQNCCTDTNTLDATQTQSTAIK
jgi:hypothetical protein